MIVVQVKKKPDVTSTLAHSYLYNPPPKKKKKTKKKKLPG